MKVTAVMICHKFWNRFKACAPYWEEAAKNGPENWLKVKVCYPESRPAINTIPHGVFEYQRAMNAYPGGGKLESKPAMLRETINSMRRDPPTYVLFTDADIIPPHDLFEAITSQQTIFWVANRVDLNQVMTESFLRNGTLPSNQVLKSITPVEKKIGMGWFQMIRWEALNAILPSLDWYSPGYDKFDYSLWQEAKKRFGCSQIMTERPFVHLWHGDPGSTWKGTKKEW